jgi:hypothetical protein
MGSLAEKWAKPAHFAKKQSKKLGKMGMSARFCFSPVFSLFFPLFYQKMGRWLCCPFLKHGEPGRAGWRPFYLKRPRLGRRVSPIFLKRLRRRPARRVAHFFWVAPILFKTATPRAAGVAHFFKTPPTPAGASCCPFFFNTSDGPARGGAG